MNFIKQFYKSRPVYCVSLKKECCCEPEKLVIHSLEHAKNRVIIIAYKFDNPLILNQLKLVLKKGIQVIMILDYKQNYQNEYVSILSDLGAEIYLWKRTEKLHAKFIIIDDTHVLTGSFNLTMPITTSSNHHKIDLMISLYDYNAITSFMNIYHEMMQSLKNRCQNCDNNNDVN